MKASERTERSGRLYVVATPIGNLGDITYRAVETLRSVDAIASEDTRRTRKLLAHCDIRTPLVAYHEHNEEKASRAVLERILGGQDVALVTDAGTPLVSDPGYKLVELAAAEGVQVISVPGPSAVVAALSISGLPPMPFHFEGFLPRRPSARRAKLASVAGLAGTLVFYVSPHRVGPVLGDMLEVLGDRRAALARELTKVHEEVLRGTLGELSELSQGRPLKGEIVVLVEGSCPRRRGAEGESGG